MEGACHARLELFDEKAGRVRVVVERLGGPGDVSLHHLTSEPPGAAVALGDERFDEPVCREQILDGLVMSLKHG